MLILIFCKPRIENHMEYIEQSIELKNKLDALRPLKKEDELRIMQKFRLDWNYHSNHLEGNTLTYGETKALILFGITAQGKPLKDHFEITGHDQAIKWILEVVNQERPLTENFIRELHKLILKESYEVDAITPEGNSTKKKVNVGVYKQTPNHVKTKTGEIFRFATPEETPALMNDLVTWYRKEFETQDKNPILLAAEFHYRYIRIHPFDDGNGRTARILMNFILMQCNYPPVIIKTNDKENYFAALRQADAGSIEPFIEYIAKNLNHSLEIMIKGAKGESIEEPDDIDKEITLLEQKLKGLTQSIKVKNKTNILDVFDHSVLKLIEKFIAKGKRFAKFYETTDLSYNNKKISFLESNENFLLEKREKIHKYTHRIILKFQYLNFTQKGIHKFDHSSKINIEFELSKYSITSSSGLKIEKMYGEQLTEQEIITLVHAEMKKHTVVIENKIEEIKKKKG